MGQKLYFLLNAAYMREDFIWRWPEKERGARKKNEEFPQQIPRGEIKITACVGAWLIYILYLNFITRIFVPQP
jgi:hypothetical protein